MVLSLINPALSTYSAISMRSTPGVRSHSSTVIMIEIKLSEWVLISACAGGKAISDNCQFTLLAERDFDVEGRFYGFTPEGSNVYSHGRTEPRTPLGVQCYQQQKSSFVICRHLPECG